ncbi:MAG: response regulator, partial [Burkholderiales bacterium]
MRILVVDDDDSDRLAVRRCIRQCGLTAELDEVASAQDAQSRIALERYDCVLLDYYLPGADTVSLLLRLRETAKDTPIVILTGRGDENIAVEFMKSGAADYVPKASLTP